MSHHHRHHPRRRAGSSHVGCGASDAGCRTPSLHARRAFTLVEILVVVVILGILAAIVIPQFTSAAATTRENSLKMDLFRIRQQLEVYKAQHFDQAPTDFAGQMTGPTNTAGEIGTVGDPGYKLGPYIPRVPVNAFTGGNTVSDTKLDPDADWYYDSTTGDFHANDSADHWAW